MFLYAAADKRFLFDQRNFLANFLLVKVPVAFVEEVFFRVSLSAALSGVVQSSFAIILTSVAFTAGHIGQLLEASGTLLWLKMASLTGIFALGYIAAGRYTDNRNLAYVTMWHCWVPVQEHILNKIAALIWS
jgi:membrane protease YdiL (CAAX protease family)